MSEYIFSVIIPIYNEGNGMKKCLQSILKQSYNDFEVILVDDGSTDCSSQICDEYARKYSFVKVIHKENGGSVDARKEGINVAKGKYIVFVDGDDYVEDDYMKELHKAIENKAEYYILNSKYSIVNKKELKVQKKNFENEFINIDKATEWILCGIDGYLWDKIYVSDIIRKNNIEFSKKITFGDDIYMNLQYLKHVKKIYTQNSSSYIHIWSSPTSICNLGVSKNRFKELDVVFEEAISYLKQLKLPNYIYEQFISSNVSVLMQTIFLLVRNNVSPKEIINAIDNCKLANSLKNYKPHGLKNKLYAFLLKKRYIKLTYVFFIIREKIKKM